MDSANKIISLLLGVFVIIVLFVILTGRLKLNTHFLSGLGGTTPTPTTAFSPTPKVKVTIVPTSVKYAPYNTTRTTQTPQNVNTIPTTGSPTIMLPLMASLLLVGFQLKKRAK